MSKITKAEAEEALRDCIDDDVTIRFASQAAVDSLVPWVDEVLTTIGHPTAWVSDESTVSDFDLTDAEIAQAANDLCVHVERHDYIIEVAMRLRDRSVH